LPINLNPPHGQIKGGDLVLTLAAAGDDLDAERVKAALDGELQNVQSHLGRIATDAVAFNHTLREKARTRIEARRERLLKARV